MTLRERIETALRERAILHLKNATDDGSTELWRRDQRGLGKGMHAAIDIIAIAFREHENEKRRVRRARRRR